MGASHTGGRGADAVQTVRGRLVTVNCRRRVASQVVRAMEGLVELHERAERREFGGDGAVLGDARRCCG
ncbi:hypothetical protein [Streptomyces sp. NBC_01353]|uniref:hypothetical protein n=1 Tax=Streptomyces sp. NBC_01353 TaxID=2903835 RepID=UPI002E2FC423|nr:hypothetical protein [Streptomyces sp. NBC_01353]